MLFAHFKYNQQVAAHVQTAKLERLHMCILRQMGELEKRI